MRLKMETIHGILLSNEIGFVSFWFVLFSISSPFGCIVVANEGKEYYCKERWIHWTMFRRIEDRFTKDEDTFR